LQDAHPGWLTAADSALAAAPLPSAPPSPPSWPHPRRPAERDALVLTQEGRSSKHESSLDSQAARFATVSIAVFAVCLSATMHSLERDLTMPATWIAISSASLHLFALTVSPDDTNSIIFSDGLFVISVLVYAMYNAVYSESGIGALVAIGTLLYRLSWPRNLPHAKRLEYLWITGNRTAFIVGVLYVGRGCFRLAPALWLVDGTAQSQARLGGFLAQEHKTLDKTLCGVVFIALSVIFSNGRHRLRLRRQSWLRKAAGHPTLEDRSRAGTSDCSDCNSKTEPPFSIVPAVLARHVNTDMDMTFFQRGYFIAAWSALNVLMVQCLVYAYSVSFIAVY